MKLDLRFAPPRSPPGPGAAAQPLSQAGLRRLLAPIDRIRRRAPGGEPLEGMALGLLLSLPLWAAIAALATALA